MRYEYIKQIQPLEQIRTLKPLKRAIYKRNRTLRQASQIDLIVVGTNLLFKGHLILEGQIQAKTNITADRCVNKAYEIIQVVNNYKYQEFSQRELRKIQRDFKLK